jgi:uncharacterized membrane protein
MQTIPLNLLFKKINLIKFRFNNKISLISLIKLFKKQILTFRAEYIKGNIYIKIKQYNTTKKIINQKIKGI